MSEPDPTAVDTEQWHEQLAAKRAEKDEFFESHPQSPIPPEKREDFDGLTYFEPDPTYRVDATVTVHDDPEVVLMDTTGGREMRYLRVATLTFDLERGGSDESTTADDGAAELSEDDELESGTYDLAAYQLESPNDEPLFVPMRDKTTGQQTYQGGRYMELSPDRELDDGDEIVLDLNLAYTPFCAYSDTFDCPLPPEENWLEVAIPAGERFE
ncbi:DUF1684 domain-containing protein [Salinadaptatus halalkaliphilus]|uniref:DUF1684 domain-containing protein n=1 Tax=Salinadaptatus halalkaliphilus TaxID=2419781 RepID=A0A4S3TN87_9EURY|nr:DUF1684 domain-containing protein [Salinadaptatus halalkaliphilus]THE65721.1 DUF1684 domain-containing protein [Salinadaptatus halalkaliphilus]